MSLLEQILEKTPPEQKALLMAFSARWDAFLKRYGTILIAHGFTDFRDGFATAWEKFRRGLEDAPG
jgi:hypothetical protein